MGAQVQEQDWEFFDLWEFDRKLKAFLLLRNWVSFIFGFKVFKTFLF